MAPHRGDEGEAHYACAPARPCAVFLLARIRHGNRDRGCEPTQLAAPPNRESGGYATLLDVGHDPLCVLSAAPFAAKHRATCWSSPAYRCEGILMLREIDQTQYRVGGRIGSRSQTRKGCTDIKIRRDAPCRLARAWGGPARGFFHAPGPPWGDPLTPR
jgi:hypothetical protein